MDASDKPDPGQQLVGTFDTIEDAVKKYQMHESEAPIITKRVTWQTTIKDIT